MRGDEAAIAAAASTCKTLLSTSVPSGQSRSNAELALPVVADMLRKGQVKQAQAVVDRTVAQFPKVKGGLRIVAKSPAVLGRVADVGRAAAAANDPSEGNP